MVPANDNATSRSAPTWGVRLPAELNPTSISLLSDPSSLPSLPETNDSAEDTSSTRKAVLLLCSNVEAGNRRGDIGYQLFQLEVLRGGNDQGLPEARFDVMATLCSNGTFAAPSSASTASGVFLASASFDFPRKGEESCKYKNGHWRLIFGT